MKTYYVYKHTFPNTKVYIGITCLNPSLRWRSDGSGYKMQTYMWNAIKKYGWNNVRHEILASGLTKESACLLEVKLIEDYDSTNPKKGYNISSGGESGRLGVPLSDEHKDAIRRRHLGIALPDATRNRISEALKGREFSDAHRKHLSESHTGCVGNNRGKKFSKEHCENIAKSKSGYNNPRRRRVMCIETGVIYDFVKDAAKAVGLKESHGICDVCSGKRKTAAGCHWKYVD